MLLDSINGREIGIRTPGGVTLNGFQDRRFRPLSHFPNYSVFSETHSAPSWTLSFVHSTFCLVSLLTPCQVLEQPVKNNNAINADKINLITFPLFVGGDTRI